MSPRPRRLVLRLVLLAVLVAGAFAAVALTGPLSSARVEGWVDGLGGWAPVAFIAVSASLTVVFFPGPVLAGASGLLFGTALGTPVSIASATLGACLAFLIARRVAPDAVAHLARGRAPGAQAFVERRGFFAVLYARLLPGMPYNLINYVAGLTRIRLVAFAAATALGVAPRGFAYTALGGSLGNLGSPEALIAFAIIIGMAAAAGVVAWRRRDELRDLRPRRRDDGPGGAGVPGGPSRDGPPTASGPGTGSSSPAVRSAGPP